MHTRRLLKRYSGEAGQTMAEYAVVLTLITIALAAVFGSFETAIEHGIEAVGAALPH